MPRNATPKGTSKSSRTSPRASSKGSSHDALRILADDHKKVLDMFDEFKELKNDPDEEAKQQLVEATCAELTIHTQVEEEIFYPAARDVIDEMDLLDEAEVEHAAARQLITELAAMEPDDDLYDARFTVLGEYVRHHIKEEEKELFPKLKKADIDLDEIGDEIEQRKMELREELGVSPEESEPEDDEDALANSRSRKNLH
ncbi:MAG TPA: hemerythrin domain-containing protein [Noviherbaspirillum sp.]|uniref:hemerythrin domain-containing protein n=1 Tax=Noviherbaspirillum sp. TaxID=1926288 RepID=UPI002B4A40E1|nr:hemerythrin domain-containing protein [Noviherbaspirillum sp.]HJV86040.1 hemerythrin domain-containing protein [Noviherbaspirillum sp.]